MIVDIYKNLKQHKINKKNILLSLKRTKRSHAFRYFRPHLRKLIVLSKTKRISKILKECSFENAKSLISHMFYKKIKKLCHEKILNNLIEHKSYKKVDQKILAYLEDNMNYYLLESNIKRLLIYLKNINKESSLYFSISKIISDEYIKNHYKINSKIISLIHTDSNFTSYVQTNELSYLEGINPFNKEFYQIETDIHKYLEKDNIFQAKKHVDLFMSFHKQNAHLMKSTQLNQSLFNIGKKLSRKNIFDKAYDINHYVFLSSKGNLVEKSAFEILFNFIKKKEYDKAVNVINKLKLLEDFEKYQSRLKYWIAFSIEKYGQKDLANTLYKKLIKMHPMTFYAIVSFKENSSLFNKKNIFFNKIKVKRNISSFYKQNKKIFYSLKRLRVWSEIEERMFISKELESIIQYINENSKKFHKNYVKSIVFALGSSLNKRKKYLYTFQLTHKLLESNKIDLNDEILTLLFPRPYLKSIKKHNSKIDPHLVLSLIRQESAFNPHAISRAGARGLMQLMPLTAKRFKKNLRLHSLNNPKLNLKIGMSYLDYLIRKYDGNLIYFLAGYNAGENRLKTWSKEIFYTDDPLITIEMIPFLETRNYVKLVYRNLFFYKYLSNQSDFLKKTLDKSFIVKI